MENTGVQIIIFLPCSKFPSTQITVMLYVMFSIHNCGIWSENLNIINNGKPERCMASDYTSTGNKWSLYLSRFEMTNTDPLSGF